MNGASVSKEEKMGKGCGEYSKLTSERSQTWDYSADETPPPP